MAPTPAGAAAVRPGGGHPAPGTDPRGTADRTARAREALDRATDEIASMVVGDPDPAREEELFGIPGLIARSAGRQAQLATAGELTRRSLAAALLGTYRHLLGRVRLARRAGDGALLWRNPATGRDEPWTAARPHGVDEVPPFTPANVAAWSAAAAPAPPRPTAALPDRPAGGRPARRSSVPAGDRPAVASQPTSQRLTWGGRGTGGLDAVRVTVLVTPEMRPRPGGQPAAERRRIELEVTAAVVAHLTTLTPAACYAAAERLMRTPDVALTIADWETFDALRADEDWLAVDVFPGFLGQLARYAYVPEEALRGPARAAGHVQPGAQSWAPAWHERYPDAWPEERLRYALALIARARRRSDNRYPPGTLYPRSGLMFVAHGPTTDTGLWLRCDLRLYEVSERELALDAFREAVISAGPTVTFGWCVIALTIALMAAPTVVEAVAVRLAPLLEMTPAELQFFLATHWEDFVTVALAGWDVAQAIHEVGLAEFLTALKDPRTAAEMLFLILQIVMAGGGGRGRRGAAGGSAGPAGTRRRPTVRVPVRRSPARRPPRGQGRPAPAQSVEPTAGRPAVPVEPDARGTGARATGGTPERAGAAGDRGTGQRLGSPRRPRPPRTEPPAGRGPRGRAPVPPPEPYPLLERNGRTWSRVDGRPMRADRLYVSPVYRRGGVRFYLVGSGADWAAVSEVPAGAVVYVVRDGRGQVVYVGMTERRELVRLGEHIQNQGGEWLGQANRFEVRATGLLQRSALSLEEDMIQGVLATGRRPLNRELHPVRATLGRDLEPQDVPRTNANFGFWLEYL